MSEPIAKSDSTVLVTGGSGFLGGRAINQLLGQGYRVRTTVRDESKSPAVRDAVTTGIDGELDLTFFEADLGSDHGWNEAVEGCEYVLHIASPFPSAQPKNPQIGRAHV